jgi:hypothetical protein
VVRRASGFRFCIEGRIEREPGDQPEHAPGKDKRMAPAYRKGIRGM